MTDMTKSPFRFLALCVASVTLAGGLPTTARAESEPIRFHSRHIPASHLMLNDFAKSAQLDTLSTCLEMDKIGDFRKWGVDTIELRLCWWNLEKVPGVYDFSRFDADLARVEAAGLKGGLMCWFFFPPDWCKEGVRFRCTRHQADANFLSPWDPASVATADRIYSAVADRYGEYVVGAPQVPRATLRLADGRTFTVTAKGLSKANRYVKSVSLNGRPVTDWKIRHADIVKGGELVFEMKE